MATPTVEYFMGLKQGSTMVPGVCNYGCIPLIHTGSIVMRTEIQSNFNGWNTLGTMKISSRQGKFEPMRVDNSEIQEV